MATGNIWGLTRVEYKALTLLGPSVFPRFSGNFRKFKDSGNTKLNTTDEPKIMKERGDIELSTAILRRHLRDYKWPLNSCVVLKSLFCA